MSNPRALILRAPGINCERETYHAFELAGASAEYMHVKSLRTRPEVLDRFEIIAFPGGFAYGDDIQAGRVLANELRHSIGEQLLGFVERGGLVLGICNGFQALVRLGILPRVGAEGLQQQVSLTHNLSDHYECRWVTLKAPKSRCQFLPEGLTIHVPAAHGEGYLQPGSEEFGQLLDAEGYTAFHYIDADGDPTTAYPANPNGSPGARAALTDTTGRVLGLMPHPDRAYLPFHGPDWRRQGLPQNPDGMEIFSAMVTLARS